MYSHYIFYISQEGTWKFGLKDLGLAQHGRVAKMNMFPVVVNREDFRLVKEFEAKQKDLDDERWVSTL